MFHRLLSIMVALLIAMAVSDSVAALTVGFSTNGSSNAVAFSPPGSSLFTSSFNTSVRGGANLSGVSTAYDRVGRLNILFPSTGPSDSQGGFVETWDVSTETLVHTSGRFGSNATSSRMATGPNGNLIIALGFSPNVLLNSYVEYDPIMRSFPGFVETSQRGGVVGDVNDVAFDGSGNLNILFPATGRSDSEAGFIETWDVSTGTLLHTSPRFGLGAMSSRMTQGPNGNLYVALNFSPFSTLNTLVEYDPASRRFLDFVETSQRGGRVGAITGIAFDENGNLNIGCRRRHWLELYRDLGYLQPDAAWDQQSRSAQHVEPDRRSDCNPGALLADAVLRYDNLARNAPAPPTVTDGWQCWAGQAGSGTRLSSERTKKTRRKHRAFLIESKSLV